MDQALSLKAIGPDLYENTFKYAVSSTRQTLYGGHLISLGVKAALLTIPTTSDWLINSVHCNFIRPGRPEEPVIYEIYNKRDGQILSHRNVVAKQNEKIVMTCSVSFKLPDKEGADLPYIEGRLSSLPGPNDIESVSLNDLPYYYLRTAKLPAMIKLCSPPQWLKEKTDRVAPVLPRTSLWIKTKKDTIKKDQNMQRIGLLYASDAGMAGAVLWQYPTFRHTLITSLDHSLWFHEDVDINKWHLFDIQCLCANSAGTNLNISKIYSEDGTLVATAMQQGYIRGPKL